MQGKKITKELFFFFLMKLEELKKKGKNHSFHSLPSSFVFFLFLNEKQSFIFSCFVGECHNNLFDLDIKEWVKTIPFTSRVESEGETICF